MGHLVGPQQLRNRNGVICTHAKGDMSSGHRKAKAYVHMATWKPGCPQGTLASVLGGDREQLGLRLGLVSVVTGGTDQGGSV